MKRNIITIDEGLCNGCGNCITGCAEGALQLVNGKAKLVKDQFCDGFGDCIGTCPTGALQIVERDSDAYDEDATRDHVEKTRGADGVAEFDAAAQKHDAPPAPAPRSGGCPGSMARMLKQDAPKAAPTTTSQGPAGQVIPSELNQWPVQLHLVQPGAPFFAGKELVVLSTCSPIASPDTNWRFVRGRGVVVACPKLDRTEGYVEKLAAILSDSSIPKVIVVRMEVPCCGGLSQIVAQAAASSGRSDLIVEEATIALSGELAGTRLLT
jgi:Pyruvate/2-oxoacid:ferredoxin oxidoreductase delta subunit